MACFDSDQDCLLLTRRFRYSDGATAGATVTALAEWWGWLGSARSSRHQTFKFGNAINSPWQTARASRLRKQPGQAQAELERNSPCGNTKLVLFVYHTIYQWQYFGSSLPNHMWRTSKNMTRRCPNARHIRKLPFYLSLFITFGSYSVAFCKLAPNWSLSRFFRLHKLKKANGKLMTRIHRMHADRPREAPNGWCPKFWLFEAILAGSLSI